MGLSPNVETLIAMWLLDSGGSILLQSITGIWYFPYTDTQTTEVGTRNKG